MNFYVYQVGRFIYGLQLKKAVMPMYKRRDNSLNLGCANCAHYVGRQPVNVPNFACNAGVEQFKVFFCYNFLGKGIHENERIQSDTQTKNFS